MTKRKFLEELEKRLNVLDESEKQDILNEYKDMIAEKIKHGKTEKEAIADFGSIEELSKEILSAYKINPNYNKSNEKTSGEKAKEMVNNGEDLIKEGAKKLSDFTKNVIDDVKKSDNNITIELIFEIMIKAIIMLFGFAILRLPFWLIKELGISILDVAFVPVNHVLIFMWSALISILYFVTCVLIAIIVFKKYFNYENKNMKYKATDNNKKKKEDINQFKEEKKVKEEIITNKKTSSDTSTSVLLTIIKIFVTISILIPMFFINLGLVSALAVALFLLIKGLNVLGFIIVIIGLITIIGHFSSIIFNFLFCQKRIFFFPFVIGMILLVFGSVLAVDTVVNLTYYDSLPNNNFEQKTVTYNEKINTKTYILNDTGTKEVVVNNDLEDGEIRIEVTYHNELVKVNKKTYSYNSNSTINISVEPIRLNKRNLVDLVINELKKDRVYNYTKLFQGNIVIYANDNTIDLIK
jgi:uncharacterized membrane protein